MTFCRERWQKRNEFVNDAACAPDVSLLIVLAFVDLFWAHVVWSSNTRGRKFLLFVLFYYSGEAKVTKLNIITAVKENVRWLEITMQNFAAFDASIVTFSKRQQNLHEDFPDNVLGHKILFRLALFDELSHISIFAIFHDNEDFLLVSDDYFFDVFYNIIMIKFT